MEHALFQAMLSLFRLSAFSLRTPQFRKLPFSINFEAIDSDPRIREIVFDLLRQQLGEQKVAAMTMAPGSCRVVSAIYADRVQAPFILPIEIAGSVKSPLGLYGGVSPEHDLVMFNIWHMPAYEDKITEHPVVRMLEALRESHYHVRNIIVLFDSDRRRVLRSYLSSNFSPPIVLRPILDMYDVILAICHSPKPFGVDKALAERALKHYEEHDFSLPHKH